MKTNNTLLHNLKKHQWCVSSLSFRTFKESLENLDMSENISIDDTFLGRKEMIIDEFGTAHISITGMLVDEAPAVYEKIGYVTTYKTLSTELSSAYQNASSVILHANSGGGMVSGCIEVADMIANSPIPIHAHIAGLGASACYKLIAGADTISATQSSEVGSIGTMLMIYNFDDEDLMIITNEGATLKGIGAKKLTEEQEAHLQESINKAGKKFQNHVTTYRTVNEEVFKAGTFDSEDSLEMGLIDHILTAEELEEMARA